MAETPTKTQLQVIEDVNVTIDKSLKGIIVLKLQNNHFDYNKLKKGITLFGRLSSDKEINDYIKPLPYLVIVKGIKVNPVVKKYIDGINNIQALQDVYRLISEKKNR